MDELRAISTFIRAAELGSFNRAAHAQGSTPQAVSKAIRQLEEHLGVRLFHRTTRKSALTDDGARLLESVRDSMEGVRAAMSRVRCAAYEDEGLIRISAGGAVGRKVLMPVLAEFSSLYPAITFDLLLEDRLTDAVAERIDVGFKAGNAPVLQVVSRRLFPIQLVVCASPDYLAMCNAPVRIDDLAKHRCVGYRQPGTVQPMPWEFEVKGETVFKTMAPVFCCSDPEAEMHAVLTGIGIGQIDSINAAAPLRAGQLVPLLVGSTSERMGLYMFYAQRSNMPRRVRRFIDFVIARLGAASDFHVPAATLRKMAKLNETRR
ncbi:LysR family transcriptional regulator [Cupriavidus agavae]|uniref:DNA-binding transcriptional LysR family regulator n=1 Tax=Cupriavidus agavae TaxID=1001822 RepID=A0A4Q7RPR9_9BURK|nr:LysR family transcriptional regulator [Cupriavidus agavae]RZT35593.1 DNA-binding transcriptional LysR family regulator [Cupriavidus agavae]